MVKRSTITYAVLYGGKKQTENSNLSINKSLKDNMLGKNINFVHFTPKAELEIL